MPRFALRDDRAVEHVECGKERRARVKAWLARHSRFHLHYTPTYASWLNQLERWFALITHQAIRRGSFRNVRELIRNIDSYGHPLQHSQTSLRRDRYRRFNSR